MTTEAYIEWAEKQRPLLSNLARGFLHDEQATEDVVQESLLRLWLLRDRIEGWPDFNALSVRITKNVCISLWRKQQKMKTVALEALEELDGCCASEGLENREKQQLLARALAALPPSERRIFTLWQQDMSIQQIAVITGAKPRTVSSMLSLARKKLYEKLKSEIS